MLTETKILDSKAFTPPYNLPPEETIYFDIETTGFSADVTALYLIGCIYYDDCKWGLIQWFAEDKTSEKETLTAFSEFLQDKKYLICYNGTTFDLPYLRKKYKKHNLYFNTDKFEIIDFYRVFSSYKNFLDIKGLKQKNVETYLGIFREDKCSGGELIEQYIKYLKLRFSDSPEKEEIYKTLLLHNSDDLAGMAKLTKLYNFLQDVGKLINSDESLDINYEINDNINIIVLSTFVEFDFIKTTKFSKDDFYLEIICENARNKVILALNIFDTELKLFYKDYKNYYYLPKEDTAIHKNLATFVDKENKVKATAANCYTKHKGRFVKIPEELALPILRIDYSDKILYTPFNDKLLNSNEKLNIIFKSVLRYIIK
nr:ribonuclease H-like domain-containing protein [uncultured Catonella sp.]